MEPRSALVERFSTLDDPRIDRAKRHKLVDVIAIVVVGVVCGAETWDEIEIIAESKELWLRGFLELPNGIPSHDTLARVFARMSPAEFERRFSEWMNEIASLTEGEVVAIDGKCLRRTGTKLKCNSAVHMVSAWATGNCVVLGSRKVDCTSNEITAIPKLLDALELKGSVVTIDAIGCQKEIAEKIVEKGADYVLGLKGNQDKAFQATVAAFEEDSGYRESTETIDVGHGRIDLRVCRTLPAEAVLELAAWPTCKSVAMVIATRETEGKTSNERRYYLSSLAPDPDKIGAAIRAHWGIENSLHWVLDVQMNEDQSRARAGDSAENLAVVRRVAVGLLRREKTFRGGTRKKGWKCMASNEYLGKVLFGAD